jgi:hypothetical protein
MPHTLLRILAKRCVSQVPGLPRAICRKGFLGKGVEPAGVCISFDRCVESIGVKHFEPSTKAGQFRGRQLLDSFFDIFGGCHLRNITSQENRGRVCEQRPGSA